MVFEDIEFYSWLEWFEGVGGFDVILPFLLIFAITFAILDRIKVFEDRKSVNVVVSIVISLFLVIQKNLVEIIQGFLPRVSMFVLVILMFVLVLGIFVKKSEWSGLLTGFGGIIALLGVLWAIGATLKWNVPFLDLFTEQDVAVLIIIGVFVLVIYLIVRQPGGEGPVKTLGKGISKLGEEIKK